MTLITWISDSWIEIFGAVTGILYVFLEIRQNLWLWPVGIITSAVYIWVFFSGKLYADMSLQVYYLVISVMGWYWWMKGMRQGSGVGSDKVEKLTVTRLKFRTGLILTGVFLILYSIMWIFLSRFTDSPVPVADSFVTSLSVVATWMLARKIYEHWYLWIAVNSVSAVLFLSRDLYATVVLYIIYCIMSFAGLKAWKVRQGKV